MVMKLPVIRLTAVVALLIFTVPLAAGAQPAGKVYRVGILGDKAVPPRLVCGRPSGWVCGSGTRA